MLNYNNERKEYEYISENNITYSLYEGLTIPQLNDIDERKTSDIVFIVLDNYTDIPTQFVDFVYGACFLAKDKEMEKTIKAYVDEFEDNNRELIEQIKK